MDITATPFQNFKEILLNFKTHPSRPKNSMLSSACLCP
ncbi:conserved hypothetical protein [delta proteobacterium NaphS2]|nr:conserved hypothetical protein [delta proteobacterium NaphS2]